MATLYSHHTMRRHIFGEAASYPTRKISLSDLTERRCAWVGRISRQCQVTRSLCA
ncbi:hypothetical protein ACVWXO_009276 [Bradyrhizobium sp. LM2.7]